MADSRKPRRRVKLDPDVALKGAVITVKTLAEHEMKSGVRYVEDKALIYPRFILNKLICRYNGAEVFVADWGSGTSANPYLAFRLRVDHSGPVEIEWIDDDGVSTHAAAELTVLDDTG
ncbi:MAG: thiosulfate oxidation carrier complex protein SoxZ [Alphaproteobacteria bacterium]|jgi:sulfur-oxidizing protein SoxZ